MAKKDKDKEGFFLSFLSTANFYSRIFVSWVSKGFKDKPEQGKPLGEGQFYYSVNRIYTARKVKKMFFINEFPRFVDAGFLHDIKNAVSTKVADTNKTYGTQRRCEVVDITKVEPYDMNFSTFKNRSRMRMWKRRYDKAMSDYGGNSDIEDMVADQDDITRRDRNSYMIESWLFVRNAQTELKSSFCKSNFIIELVADSDDILKECEAVLVDYCASHEIKLSTVFLQTNEYNKNYTAAGNANPKSLIQKMNPPTIMTDDLLNQFDIPSHGKVFSNTGTYFGTDIYSGLPVHLDLESGSDAMNFLISAKTGQGKSNLFKGLYGMFNLMGYNTIALDFEGDEYTDIGKLFDSTFIKVSGEDSRYYNTVAIGDLTGIERIDKNLKREAITVTQQVFSILLDGMDEYELSLYNDAINRLYTKAGVTDAEETWYLSKQCNYFLLYAELCSMAEEDAYERDYKDQIRRMIIKLRVYFERDGIHRSLFNNPIDLSELLGHRNIVFSFGMKGADVSLIDTKEIALKQLFVGYISSLVSNYNKSKNRLTVIMIEELQRYLLQESSAAVVANMVSGGRKRGMIMFLITNAPLQLIGIQSDDEKHNLMMTPEVAQHLNAINENITAFVIGALQNKTSKQLSLHYDELADSLPHMKLINSGGSMRYSFLVRFKGETTIVKHLFHPALLQTSLYATRKDLNGENKDDVMEDRLRTFDGDIKREIENMEDFKERVRDEERKNLLKRQKR